MAQLWGRTGNNWFPLNAILDILNRYVLRVSNAGIVKHYNGDADILAAPVALGSTTRHVKVKNTHVANTVSVSFDGGTNYFTIKAGQILEIDAEIASIEIKASINGTPYEILTLE